MEIKRLQHFLAVIDAGSVSNAARKLRMSQGALSLSIQALERDTGSLLFNRSSDGMTPNEVGRTLETRARLVTNEIKRAEREIREFRGGERGRVALATAPHFTDVVLPRAINRFQRAHPDVEVSVMDGYLASVVPAVKNGAVDLALATLSATLTMDPDLAHKPLMPPRPLSIFVAAGHPLASRRKVPANDVMQCKWVLPLRSDFFRAQLDRHFAALGVPAPNAAVECGSTAMARRLVCEGPYVSVFSKLVMWEEIERGRVKTIDSPEMRWENELGAGAFFRRGTVLSPAAEKLTDVIGEVCREMLG